jgi:hypothetical protein
MESSRRKSKKGEQGKCVIFENYHLKKEGTRLTITATRFWESSSKVDHKIFPNNI